MKKIFVIDWALIPSFLLTAFSGIKLHLAGHGVSHGVWHNWAVFHIIVSLAFLVLGICHVKTHWNWHKSILKRGIGNKSRLTVAISLLFILVCITGIVVLGVEGANSGVGLWHYRIGLVITLLAMIHIIKRLTILRKSLAK